MVAVWIRVVDDDKEGPVRLGRVNARCGLMGCLPRCGELARAERWAIPKLLNSIRPVSVGTNQKARWPSQRTNQSAGFVAG